MGDIVGNNGDVQFANGQSSRDLRDIPEALHERTDLIDPFEALRKDSDEALEPRVESPGGLQKTTTLRVEAHGTDASASELCWWCC